MKKANFLALLAVAALLPLGGCGDNTSTPKSNAPTSGQVAGTQIVLTASKAEAYVGETVTITSSVSDVTYDDVDASIAIFDKAAGTLRGIAPGKVTVKAKKAGCKAGTVEVTFVAEPVVEPDATIEWEDAEHESANGWTNGSETFASPVLEEENSNARGGKYVGCLAQGNKETLTFTADKDATMDIGMIMAATQLNMSDWSISDVTLSEAISLTLNGTAIDLTGAVLPGNKEFNFYGWKEVKFKGLSIKKGENKIVLTVLGSQGPNLDGVNFYGKGVTIQVVKGAEPVAPTISEIGTYTYYVDGYEWGPGVKEVVIDLGAEVAASDLANDLFSVKALGAQGGARTVSDVYLANDDGSRSSAAKGNKIAIEMTLDVTYTSWGSFGWNSYNGCDPFSYNQQTGRNTWAQDYGFEVALVSGKSLKVGSKTYGGTDLFKVVTPSANPKVVRAVKDWSEAKTFTLGERTIGYKAYEPAALKSDTGRNPLIIWLHGQGEGGTDPDIALLGNDVTNLGENQIQSYFKVQDGIQGAYVLAPQAPTMWMDTGNDTNNGGEAKSIFTAALKGLIDKYIADNNDIDTNRIYIGGCSNGGYMTMNMVTEYPSFFAAAYPICEAYKDSFLTNEEVNSLVNLPMWFVAAADDTTVDPTQFSIPTFQRIKNAGNTNAHFSFFEHVYGEDTGKQVQYMGHYSWVYAFRDEVKLDQADVNNIAAPSTAAVQINGKNVGLWDWLAAQHK